MWKKIKNLFKKQKEQERENSKACICLHPSVSKEIKKDFYISVPVSNFTAFRNYVKLFTIANMDIYVYKRRKINRVLDYKDSEHWVDWAKEYLQDKPNKLIIKTVY